MITDFKIFEQEMVAEYFNINVEGKTTDEKLKLCHIFKLEGLDNELIYDEIKKSLSDPSVCYLLVHRQIENYIYFQVVREKTLTLKILRHKENSYPFTEKHAFETYGPTVYYDDICNLTDVEIFRIVDEMIAIKNDSEKFGI